MGSTAAEFNGAAVVLDPRNGEVLAFTSRPAYDPNAFAAGIDRATWNALNDRRAAGRCRTARSRGGIRRDRRSRWRSAWRASRKASSRPASRALRRRRDFLRPLLRLLEEGRPRRGRPAPGDRAVLRRLLLHRRQHARRRSHQQVGDALRPRREVEHRSAERAAPGWCRRRSGRRRPANRSGTRAKRSRSRSARARSA